MVLGGGRNGGREYAAPTSGRWTLARLRHGARLYRATGLPILVTAGDPGAIGVSGAQLMRQTLERDFRVPVRWVEADSRTTLENARFSARLLHQAGIRRVLLVTQAWHMPRSVRVFERAGLEVIAAPTDYSEAGPLERGLYALLPAAGALEDTRRALHEWVGMLWYRLRD